MRRGVGASRSARLSWSIHRVSGRSSFHARTGKLSCPLHSSRVCVGVPKTWYTRACGSCLMCRMPLSASPHGLGMRASATSRSPLARRACSMSIFSGFIGAELTQRAGRFQAGDFVPVQAYLERDFLCVLAELGSGAMRMARGVAEFDRTVDDAAFGNVGMIDGGESADGRSLRVVEHFGVGAHGRPDEIVAIENGRPFVCGSGGDGAIDFAGECGAVLRACGRVFEARIVQPFRLAERAAEIRPMTV